MRMLQRIPSTRKIFGSLLLMQAIVIGTHAQTRDRQVDAPPPPGRLVDIGGWKLHLNCTGSNLDGRATVVFESGAGGTSLDWYFVQAGVSAFTRACSYDRAGTAWSNVGPHPRTIRQMEYELRMLLAKAGVPGPYVLVGHSFGGIMVRNFQLQFPNDVAGIVLVDAASDDTRLVHFEKLVRIRELTSGKAIPPVRKTILESERKLSAQPAARVARVAPPGAVAAPVPAGSTSHPPGPVLPPDIQRLRSWASSRIERGTVEGDGDFTGQEFAELYRERHSRPYPLGDLPLIVLIAGNRQMPQGIPPEWVVPNEEINKQDEELAGLSERGKFVYVQNSTHMIPDDQPQAIINAVEAVAEEALKRR